MSQIRLTRTQQIDEVLAYFREKYPLMSDADIFKMALSEKYANEITRYDIEVQDNRSGIIQFLNEYHKRSPKFSEEEVEQDIQEARSAIKLQK